MTAGPDNAISSELVALLDRAATCRLWAEQIEGPYRGGGQPMRRDVVEDRVGAPLHLGLRFADGLDGTPLRGAVVEIWHCDAVGVYSGFPPIDPSAREDGSPPVRTEYLPDETFLRGTQITDGSGSVEFRTIYPGWYSGRTVHIHLVVATGDSTYTTQLYFPEDLTEAVFATAPYRDHPDRDTTNEADDIFPSGGDPALLDVVAAQGVHRAALCFQMTAVDGRSRKGAG